jgi:hypothetical protein
MNKKNVSLILALLALMIFINGCDDAEDEESSGPTEVEGMWVRIVGASGDRTDLAIGGIDGEPENRVYMCEKKGSTAAGLYKGILTSSNVIVWDDNLPDTYIRIVNGQLEFDYKCCGALPTYYNSGIWDEDECGPLENTTIQLAVGIYSNQSNIRGVTVDNIPVPLTILNSTVTAPDCSSNSFLTLPKPTKSNQNGGYYTVGVTHRVDGIDGTYTTTDYQTFYEYYFEPGCNKYKIDSPTGQYTIVPM